METCCPVVELRQYTLHPGRRDELIELFDREFVEPQEALGIRVLGQFRDLGDPDRFVWLRGFADMESRRAALAAFYGGPVWAAHRGAANPTMIDSDNVLLLRPVRPGLGFVLPARAADGPSSNVFACTIYHLESAADDELVRELERHLRSPLAVFQTEPAENTYPRLPVRTGEHVLVSFCGAVDDEPAPPSIAARFARAPERLRLSPTSRSLLR